MQNDPVTETQPKRLRNIFTAQHLWFDSTTRRLLLWLFSRRGIRQILKGLAALAVLVALVYAEEYCRGKLVWGRYKRQMEARGERLDWAAYVPPATAIAIPYFADSSSAAFLCLSGSDAKYQFFWPGDYGSAAQELGEVHGAKRRERSLTDLVSWHTAFEKVRSERSRSAKTTGTRVPLSENTTLDPATRVRAAVGVLQDLQIYERALEGLRQDSQSPYSRYSCYKILYAHENENPMTTPLPHLANLKQICNFLKLRIVAELAISQSEKAYQDLNLMLRLADFLKGEPFLISYLVRASMFHITEDAVWEGLAQHKWSETQLKELQARFSQFDFTADIQYVLRGERAGHLTWFDYFRGTNKTRAFHELNEMMQIRIGPDADKLGPMHPSEYLMNFIPRGWIYLEQRNFALSFQEIIMARYGSESKRIEPARSRACDQKLEKLLGPPEDSPGSPRNPVPLRRLLHHNLIAALLLPSLCQSQQRAAETQTVADQATLACALERYRLSNGQFPEQLQALAPQFIEKLPHDVITGKPLIYRRNSDGGYLIYSVGWDEKDDGGVIPARRSGNAPEDWVWRMPGKSDR